MISSSRQLSNIKLTEMYSFRKLSKFNYLQFSFIQGTQVSKLTDNAVVVVCCCTSSFMNFATATVPRKKFRNWIVFSGVSKLPENYGRPVVPVLNLLQLTRCNFFKLRSLLSNYLSFIGLI